MSSFWLLDRVFRAFCSSWIRSASRQPRSQAFRLAGLLKRQESRGFPTRKAFCPSSNARRWVASIRSRAMTAARAALSSDGSTRVSLAPCLISMSIGLKLREQIGDFNDAYESWVLDAEHSGINWDIECREYAHETISARLMGTSGHKGYNASGFETWS